MTIDVRHGDSRDVISSMADASVDSVVTDPPYALVSVLQRFGNSPRSERTENTNNPYGRTGRGFMGQRWDTGDTAFDPSFWADVLRVLKPGGHLVAFGGTRTYHRLAVAIEDAGFEIRDQIGWLYGSGFPKSHDVSKGIDKAAGVTREKIPTGAPVKRMIPGADQNADGSWIKNNGRTYQPGVEIPATDAARQWQGWGTALKPAWEPIVLARKPLIGTVAANVLAHGTGAINVDGCRIATTDTLTGSGSAPLKHGGQNHRPFHDTAQPRGVNQSPLGRWPANVIHDGSEEVVGAFPDAPGQQAAVGPQHGAKKSVNTYGDYGPRDLTTPRADSGSAARFFYSAKADADDRLGSKHPTVKPVDLMAYLCRLVTPPGGTVLDPFAGSGTTGMACMREGFRAVLIEREAEYVADIERRLAHVKGEDAPLFAGAK